MPDFDGFRNRLEKNHRHFARWARRNELECYRVYDRDMPDFPLAIDRYADHVHVQEYRTRWQGSEADYAEWKNGTLEVIRQCLQVDDAHLHLKLRERKAGSAQYEKSQSRGRELVVHESGLKFAVNLDAYLDTGLFLDHRITRGMVRDRAQGKRFLNLFCYTASFTVYAAAGGASQSLSVDLSNTYLQWAQRNFALNGMEMDRHRTQQEDVFEFLRTAMQKPQRYDLIVLDPPSFSNSKRMRDILDVQRDHVQLVRNSMYLLHENGELFFSNNLRSFRLDPALEREFQVQDITRATLPPDFRDPHIHHCWILRK